MIEQIPIEAPLFIVGVIFLATAVPAFFELRKKSGWPTRLGWVYLAIVSASCVIAFQKESASAVDAEQDRLRFTALLESIERQQKIIDSGDITLLVNVTCVLGNEGCEDEVPNNIVVKPTGGRLLIEGALAAVDSTEPMSRGLPSRLVTYLGRPYFYSFEEQLVSIDEMVGRTVKIYLYRIPEDYTVSSAVILTKGYQVRGKISEEVVGGRTRTAATFEFRCYSCENPERSDD